MTNSRGARFALEVRIALYPNAAPAVVAFTVAMHAVDGFWLGVLWGVLAAVCAVHLPQLFVTHDSAPGMRKALIG